MIKALFIVIIPTIYKVPYVFEGGILPVIGIILFPIHTLVYSLGLVTILGLILLGVLSARLGGAPMLPATARVVTWGVIAMLATTIIGRIFGVSV
ncbi:VIT1/CCC1 transporter family protein [Psychrobacter sanguinis]|uniref:Uncharacterized protein n=1 Tax=Psychrobacter sanguinis TaxID=861445 RepID=A0A844LXV7_9GAMM|nr:hypothetical protein [Psychrobacter sanguinis]